jgi:hypothetical protein
MLVELFINAVQMPPWVDLEFTYNNMGKLVRYSLDSLITIFMLSRIYLVLRLLTRFTKWRSQRSIVICSKEGIEADTMFTIKCLMQERPYLVSFLNFIISSILFGFAVKIAEVVYYEDCYTVCIPVTSSSF